MKDNHDREIRKLELRLQLAQLENKTVGSTPTETSNSKSLGDMKAPQKIVNPQQWPHIFAPGEPKLYGDLSLAEFCAGYLVIIKQLADKPPRAALINHFHELSDDPGVHLSVVSGEVVPLQSSSLYRAWLSAMGRQFRAF